MQGETKQTHVESEYIVLEGADARYDKPLVRFSGEVNLPLVSQPGCADVHSVRVLAQQS